MRLGFVVDGLVDVRLIALGKWFLLISVVISDVSGLWLGVSLFYLGMWYAYFRLILNFAVFVCCLDWLFDLVVVLDCLVRVWWFVCGCGC